MYSGAQYRFPCALAPDEFVLFSAVQINDRGEVGLLISINDGPAEVYIGPKHLNEYLTATVAALGAAATNGLRLAEEAGGRHQAEALKRMFPGLASFLDAATQDGS